MRRIIFLILSLCGTSLLWGQKFFGDANCDGKIDVGDITTIQYIILNLSGNKNVYHDYADANQDGGIDNEDIEVISNIILGRNEPTPYVAIYGIKWKSENYRDLGERCFSARGKTAKIGVGNDNGTSDFDSIYPWSEIKRCNIKDNQEVVFEGENGFSLDGSNGDVFVRIPLFCINKYEEDGYQYITISKNVGQPHPAFIEDGIVLDEVFVSAFEGVIENGQMYSKANVIPTTNEIPKRFLDSAKKRGVCYSLYDMRTVDLLWCLMAVEYGCRNSNHILGYGYSGLYQPASFHKELIVSNGMNKTNIAILGKSSSEFQRLQHLVRFAKGNNICIYKDFQTNIIAQRKIIDVREEVGENLTILFDGEPVDLEEGYIVGNAAINTNYSETLGEEWRLYWHTGRTNRPVSYNGEELPPSDLSEIFYNPCRYRWIENPLGNVWQFLPDVTFVDGQMYVCDNMKDYEFHKSSIPYRAVGQPLPIQTNNGIGGAVDQNTTSKPAFWVTNIPFYKEALGVSFPSSYDNDHSGMKSTDGFGAYYYLSPERVAIANGGGFDHYIRSNILTSRAWITSSSKWYLYGARLIYKRIE